MIVDDAPERRLATFAAELTLGDVPDSTIERATLSLADTLGAMVGGGSDDAVTSLATDWVDRTPNSGVATVLGSPGHRTSAYRAAFVNGAAGTVLELDEGHRFAAGHPAVHVLPALLADGEPDFRTGDELVVAFVAGYEVAVRVARMLTPLAPGYHPHGVWGGVGAAAGVARLREYDVETTRTAMQIAAAYGQHTCFDAATEGATVRNGYAGMANLAGLIAVDQAAAGFSGLADGVARHLGRAAAGEPDRTRLMADLGSVWEIERGYFKRHAACRYTHPVLDAVVSLRDEGLRADDVSSVTVETYPLAAELTTADPRNALQAKFSIPFAVATALRNGTTGKAAFSAAAITPETTALAERVAVQSADEFANRAPDERGARVTVTTTSGEAVTREVRAARGGEHDPYTTSELREKFVELTAQVVGDERALELWEAAREPAPPRVICALTSG